MKLTPLDIHHKEFRRSIRGYDDREVDDFLDAVADEFERLFKENIDLSERIEAADERVRTYQQMESTLNNTLVAAQRSAEDIEAKAREEAATILRDAELKAKELIHDALTQKQQAAGELVRIKQAEEEFRARFRQSLEEYQAAIREVPLADDVSALVGRVEDVPVAAAEIPVTPAPVAAEERIEVPEVAPEIPAPDFLIPVEPAVETFAPVEPEPQPAVDAEPDDLAGAWETQAMPAVEEAAASGVVSSVHLGETEPPDLLGDLELETPREFQVGQFDALGEREDDIDIEEID